jgi:rhodanese-related sulfurtransferase
MQDSLDVVALDALRAGFPPPQILDVRRSETVAAHPVTIPGAVVRDPHGLLDWATRLEWWRPIVVYCAEGHRRGCDAAATLRACGHKARTLEGGLAAWQAAGKPTAALRPATRWVTRERPKIDRIACPWLVRRFIDASAQFHYVPAADVKRFASEHGATPYDVADVAYGHVGTRCTFDAFIARHALCSDPALARLAMIVRGADTAVLELALEAPGLLAVSQGLSRMIPDDHAMLHAGMLVYDALYVWCRNEVAQGRCTPSRAAA